MDTSVLSDDSDYDIVSPDASIADLGALPPPVIVEPQPSQDAQDTFNSTCNLTAEEIQSYVRAVLGLSLPVSPTRPKRIYVDGIFDGLNVRHALQLRQVKLSFPNVWVIVGVFSDATCHRFGTPAVLPAVERGELLRHCRWVDEVLEDAPCTLDAAFLAAHNISYVAIEEGATVDPDTHKLRLKGYDELKRSGVVIPTRRTVGVAAASSPLPRPRTPLVESDSDSPIPDPGVQAEIYGIGF
ncbi:unnamed protein product [Mycena citricolor]|uniref:choline-phosphate cytidylyltransferase n=1 Tax=Mycena citricolor TaxID=2018698 RepID=A0AAD2H1M8_9AGAR|nr:unnamed protein product [Mycena citricolor]CAK5273989.1 unnamed protein product [Mycena citricolor]